MNNFLKKIAALTCGLLIFGNMYAQEEWSRLDKDIQKAIRVDTLRESSFTLIYINKAENFDTEITQKLQAVFFKNYPKQVKMYNRQAIKKVVFVIDPEYKGIAAAGGGVIRFNPEWFKKNPGDIDIVTHETMHLVQNYPHNAGPGWITEGIADYVRYTMGVDNEGANWSLPELLNTHSYKDAYRITARFFVWLEKNKKKGLIRKLDDDMRNKRYTDDFWKNQTKRSVEELWSEYTRNSRIN